MILETGALTQVYEHVLAYMQDLVPEGGTELIRPVYDQEQRRTILQRKTITPEDLRHGFDVCIDTSERRMLGGLSDQQALTYWEKLVDRPDVIKSEVNRLLRLPDSTLRRLFLPAKKLDEIQQQNREAELLQQMGGAVPPPAPQGVPPGAPAGGLEGLGMEEAGMEGLGAL